MHVAHKPQKACLGTLIETSCIFYSKVVDIAIMPFRSEFKPDFKPAFKPAGVSSSQAAVWE